MENFDIVKYLRENHLGPHSILGGYVDLHALKEAEVGNNFIDAATVSAIDSWIKKNYPTARTANPAEVEDVVGSVISDSTIVSFVCTKPSVKFILIVCSPNKRVFIYSLEKVIIVDPFFVA